MGVKSNVPLGGLNNNLFIKMTSFICILGLVVLGSAFTYDETLAKELTAISFAA